MAPDSISFAEFRLDVADRRLWRGAEPVEVSARYLDALILLAGEPGRLISKDRFHEEVWRGVPVTDEALTQCIKTLRRVLGDDVSRPRFIETVPKYGYRFVGVVEAGVAGDEPVAALPPVQPAPRGWAGDIALAGAGTLGAGLAGLVGGILYGFALTPRDAAGATSMLVVLMALTMLVALAGGAGVSFGIAIASRTRHPAIKILGGAMGGLLVGAVAKLIGLDAFALLLGRSPGSITGAGEGALLGAAIGLAAWLARADDRRGDVLRGFAIGALITGAAGSAIPLIGGHLLGGSLELLADGFPGSRLRLDAIGGLFGERGFGPLSEVVTAALEAGLFGGGVIAAMTAFASRRASKGPP